MSNIHTYGKEANSCFVKQELESFLRTHPQSTETDLVTYLDFLVADLDWADARKWEVPYETIWTVRFVIKDSFACMHIKIDRNINEQLQEMAYFIWERHACQSEIVEGKTECQLDGGEYYWRMAEHELKSNWDRWREIYG